VIDEQPIATDTMIVVEDIRPLKHRLLPPRNRISATLPEARLEWLRKKMDERIFNNLSHGLELCVLRCEQFEEEQKNELRRTTKRLPNRGIIRPTADCILKGAKEAIQKEGPLPVHVLVDRLWDMNIKASRRQVTGALQTSEGKNQFDAQPYPAKRSGGRVYCYFLLEEVL